MTFKPQYVVVNASPKCRTCGKVRKRVLKDWFTVNPFNTKPVAELRREYEDRLLEEKKQIEEGGIVCKSCKERP